MQKEIEQILRKYGYAFLDGYIVSEGIYETVFRKGDQDYIMREVTHTDGL